MNMQELNTIAHVWSGQMVHITWSVRAGQTCGIIQPNVGKAPSLWDREGHRTIILIDPAEVESIDLANPAPLTSRK